MEWIRYRFYTKSVKDYRPLIFNPQYPWWCSGFTGNMKQAIIVAYLPKDEDLFMYWDDATKVESEVCEKITFSSRFPKPEYFTGTDCEER